MMSKSKFPLQLPPVAHKVKSAAQNLAFGRKELESAIRFLVHQPIANDLQRALAALPPAAVHDLGCWRCNGDVPLADAELLADRICRECADAYDAASVRRRMAMRATRLDLKHAA